MRPSKDEYFMSIAEQAAERSTCNRAKVGSCLVKDGVIIGTGYNGSARGEDSCLDNGCLCNEKGNCIRTIHSEINALINCARIGVSAVGAILYCTHKPCSSCSRAIINAGIEKVYYKKYYEGDGSIELSDFIDITNL